jgi:pimeloyl-ACP methyl ester carboxylesterase
VPQLSQRFTCYAFDLVGLGDSRSSDDVDYASPGQAAVMQQALRALGVTSYALLGNDTGGWVARELGLRDGDRVTHLALTNTEIPHHRPPWIPLYQRLTRLPGSTLGFRLVLSTVPSAGLRWLSAAALPTAASSTGSSATSSSVHSFPSRSGSTLRCASWR